MKKKREDSERWVVLPRELIRRHSLLLGTHGIAIYALLAAYANESQIAQLTYRRMHKRLGISNAEVVRTLHDLEDLHLVRPLGKPKTTGYKLLWVPDWLKPGEKAGEKPVETREDQASLYRIDHRISILVDLIISIIESLSIKQETKTTMTNNEAREEAIEYPEDDTDLACELAEALDDKDAIQMYLSYVHRFPESVLRETLTKVLSIPEEKVRKNRGALFNYLIQQYAAKKKRYPRH